MRLLLAACLAAPSPASAALVLRTPSRPALAPALPVLPGASRLTASSALDGFRPSFPALTAVAALAPSQAPAPAAAAAAPEAPLAVAARMAAPSDSPAPFAPGAEFDGLRLHAPPAFVDANAEMFRAERVERVRKNHGVGLYYDEDHALAPWIPAARGAALGVDGEGRAFHVLELPGRKVGYLLSGNRRIESLYLTEAGHLFAVDASGTLLQYDPSLWKRSLAPRIAMQAALGWGVTAAGGFLLGATLLVGQGVGMEPLAVAAFAWLSAVASLMTWGFWGLYRYERQNQATDGFFPVAPATGPLLGAEHDSGDWRLRFPDGERSLSDAVLFSKWKPGAVEDFGVKPEHTKLPRGVDPRAYEPPLDGR